MMMMMATQVGTMKLTITPEGFLQMKETPATSLKPFPSPVEASRKLMKTSDGLLTPITMPENSPKLTKAPDGTLKPILKTGDAGPRLTIASDRFLKIGEAGPRLTIASDGTLKTEEASPRLTIKTEEAGPRLTIKTEEAGPRLTIKTEEAGPRLTLASDGSLKPIIISTPKGSLKRINTDPHEESLKKIIMTSTTRGSQRLVTTSGGSLKLVKPSEEESTKQIGMATQEGSPRLLSTLEGSLKMLINITPKESTKLMKTSEGFLNPASALEEGLVKLVKTTDGSLKAVSMCQTNSSQLIKTTERASCDSDPNIITELNNDNPSKISRVHPYSTSKRTGVNTTENPSQIPQSRYNLRGRTRTSNNENTSHITEIGCNHSSRINSNPEAIAKTDNKIPQADDNNASRIPKTCSDESNPNMIPKAEDNSSRTLEEANNNLSGIPKTDNDDCKVKSFIPVCGIGEGFTESLER